MLRSFSASRQREPARLPLRFSAVAVLAVAGVIALAPDVPAADTPETSIGIPPATELAAGGLIFAARERLTVEQETLTIGIDKVEIDYALRSTSAQPYPVVMAFPLPTIDMASLFGTDIAVPAFDPGNPTNFVAFWTTIDGVAVQPEVDQRAYAIGHVDATATLRGMNLPLYPLSVDVLDKLAVLTAEQKQTLREANLIDVENGVAEPHWALRTVFHWRHTIAPDKSIAIKHHYTPVAGSAPWSEEMKERAKSRYCLSAQDADDLDKRASGGKSPTVYWVHYMPAANSWLKGPSILHNLAVEKPEGRGVVSTCASGERTVTASGIKIASTNRTDDSDIEVLMVE